MKIEEQIKAYIGSQPAAKADDMVSLHQTILALMRAAKLWFLDGKNEDGKIVSNPNIGYGQQTLHYADGTTKPFYQIGLSANTAGISVYIMGLKDKDYLTQTFGKTIGKASVTSYCIKFKKRADIDMEVLAAAINYGIASTS